MFVRAHQRATICRFKPHWASPSVGPEGKRPRLTLVLWNFILYHMCVYHDDVSLDLFLMCVCVFYFILYLIVSSINSGLSHILSFASCTCFYFGNPSFPDFVQSESHSNGWFCIKRTLMEKQCVQWWIHVCLNGCRCPLLLCLIRWIFICKWSNVSLKNKNKTKNM